MNDRAIAEIVTAWLEEEASATPVISRDIAVDLTRLRALPQERYVAQRLVGDVAGRSPVVRWGLVLIVLAGLVGTLAGVGAALLDRPDTIPGPERAMAETTILPGHRLLTDAGNTVSIQVQARWRTNWTAKPGLQPGELIVTRIGSAGLTVSRGAAEGVPFDDFVATFEQRRSAADGWTASTRTEGMHGPHRAVRIVPIPPAGRAHQVFYLVEGPGGVGYVVDLGWDPGYTPQELGFDAELILGSFNPDGTYPAFAAPVR